MKKVQEQLRQIDQINNLKQLERNLLTRIYGSRQPSEQDLGSQYQVDISGGYRSYAELPETHRPDLSQPESPQVIGPDGQYKQTPMVEDE